MTTLKELEKVYKECFLAKEQQIKIASEGFYIKMLELLDYRNICIEAQEILAKDATSLEFLAKNPGIHEKIQWDILKCGYNMPKIYLAQNPKLQALELQKAILLDDSAAAIYLASNRSLHAEIQQALFKKEDIQIYRRLAENPATIPSMQEELSYKNFADVWWLLASNKSLVPTKNFSALFLQKFLSDDLEKLLAETTLIENQKEILRVLAETCTESLESLISIVFQL